MTTATTRTADQIARLRVQALGIVDGDTRRAATPRDVVAHHLAMQAQDWSASRWAIGSRLSDATDADVRAAYDRGEIVRSWPMRGTVHVTLAQDMPWMLELMSGRALSGLGRRWEQLGIDEALVEGVRDVAVELLRGGQSASRTELAEAALAAGLNMTGPNRYHIVWYLSQTGTLVHGPARGNDHLLVLLDEWVPNPRHLSREAALAELGRRYLQARGPVTVEDLAHWTGLPKRDCRTALDAVADDTIAIAGPGGPYVMLRELHESLDPDAAAAASDVSVLAAFDEHLLGYRGRDAVLDPRHATLVDPGRNGVFRWTVVAGGTVHATWRRVRRTHHVVAEVTPFRKRLPAGVRPAVPAAIARWGRFAGVDTKVSWLG